MLPRTFLLPPRLRFGEGGIRELGAEAVRLGRRALVVSGPKTAALGRAGAAVDLLRLAGLQAEAYSGISAEPHVSHVDEGTLVGRTLGADLVVGIGGGSALDAAKAIAVQLATRSPITDCEGQDKVRAALPVLAIPTTAGTGSEVTRFTVVTRPGDDGSQVKMLIGSPLLVPRTAILDPELLLSAPPAAAAGAGVDALTHAIEAFVSDAAQPLTDDLALAAIRHLAPHLARAAKGEAQAEDLGELMLGALQAGMAFSNASVALVHGMARPLGACFGVPHGVANGLLLATVVEFNLPAAPERYARIAQALGEESTAATELVARICTACSLPDPASFGIDDARLGRLAPQMARDALRSGSPQHNPRLAGAEEIEALYRKALLPDGSQESFPRARGALE
ncbi:MAG: iron-containing alcohol dehydrogenase [Thermaerobacter sp.]|nr:iron-containing alcohol dehydrogenase [Thermaerobacter sp.]